MLSSTHSSTVLFVYIYVFILRNATQNKTTKTAQALNLCNEMKQKNNSMAL